MRAQIEEGTERKDRCYVRVWSEGKWKLKQRFIWERERGPIPPGLRICFLDGDRSNFDLDNMVLLPVAEIMSVNKSLGSHRIPELTLATIALYELEKAVKEAVV